MAHREGTVKCYRSETSEEFSVNVTVLLLADFFFCPLVQLIGHDFFSDFLDPIFKPSQGERKGIINTVLQNSCSK